jgi:hypothetical protein
LAFAYGADANLVIFQAELFQILGNRPCSLLSELCIGCLASARVGTSDHQRVVHVTPLQAACDRIELPLGVLVQLR